MPMKETDREGFTLKISEEGAKDLARFHRHNMLCHAALYFLSAIVAGLAGFIFGFGEVSSSMLQAAILVAQIAAYGCSALALVVAAFYSYCGLMSGPTR